MRILLLSDLASEHTEKWAIGLANQGIKVGLFSFNKSRYNWFSQSSNIELLFESEDTLNGQSLKEKVSYFKYLPILKQKIKEFKPDVLHAHYATSYGFLGALSRFKPFVVSVWGSDVYDFPQQNYVYKRILKYVLHKATVICSTSHCMKQEALLYTNKPITVIPFGIDIDLFKRPSDKIALSNVEEINIGNIKAIETKYGVLILIQAFNTVLKHFPLKNIKLYIIGDGSEKENCLKLVSDFGIENKVIFTGRIAHSEIAEWHQKLDIFVSLSILDSESFGVSLVEAMSSGSCVIASNVDGFKEVLDNNNECGTLVEKNSVEDAAKAIIDAISNPKNSVLKGSKARERAVAFYNWQNNIKQMIDVYNQVTIIEK